MVVFVMVKQAIFVALAIFTVNSNIAFARGQKFDANMHQDEPTVVDRSKSNGISSQRIISDSSNDLPKSTDSYPDMNNVFQKGLPGMCDSSRIMRFANMGDISNPGLQLKYVDSIKILNTGDNSKRLKSRITEEAWIEWNNKVAKEVNKVFSSLIERVDAQGKLIVTQADYVVTSDLKVKDIKVRDHCPNDKFRSMIITTLESMNGNPVLQYPKGANWEETVKSGSFVQNYGPSILKKTRSSKRTSSKAL